MFFISIISAVLTLIILLIAYWCLELYKHRSLRFIPGPAAYPLMGSIFPKDPYHLKVIFEGVFKKYGKIVRFNIGPDLNVGFARCEEIEAILSSTVHLAKSKGYDFARPWLGDGLILSSGNKKWKTRRKLITPAFHFKILEKYMKSFESNADVLVEQLDKQVGKKSVDIYEMTKLFTLDVICEAAMGIQINAQTNKNHPYVKALTRFLDIFIMRVFGTLYQADWMFWMSKYYTENKECLRVLLDFSENIIDARRKVYKENIINEINEESNNIGSRKTYALLDLLLTSADAQDLTDEDIRDEINTFIFAGNDTTSISLGFAFFELANNPEVQEKLYQEIVSVVGQRGKDLTMSELNDLKYLDQVFKETLRKYPSVPIIQRKIAEDCYIEGVKYPKGVTISVMVYELHHDPNIYPCPEKFIPERFSTENSQKRHSFAYIPFSAGLRNCIGQKYAQYKIKLAIVKILLNFTLLPVPGFSVVLGFPGTLKPKDGVLIALERRSKTVQ